MRAILVCNGPSAKGYKAPETGFLVTINDGLLRYPKCQAAFTVDCPAELEDAWVKYQGERIIAHHVPGYACRYERFKCEPILRSTGSAGCCALAWIASKGFDSCLVVGMDMLYLSERPGLYVQGHRQAIADLAPKFPAGLFILRDGKECKVDAAFLAALPPPVEAAPPAKPAPVKMPTAPAAESKTPDAIKADTGVPLIVAYFTTGTPYEVEAKLLRISLDGLDLDHEIFGVPNLGTWQRNTQFKARFLQERLEANKGKPILYLDVDCLVVHPPTIAPDCDVAACHPNGRHELNSSTLYLANTPKCAEMMTRWLALNEQYPERLPDGRDSWDQRTLQMAIDATPGIVFKALPDEYCCIPGITSRRNRGLNPKIILTRAAYRLKSQIDERPDDVVPWVVFPSVDFKRAARCARAWRDWNYKVAVLIEKGRCTDAEAESIGADKLIRSDEWKGFPHAANLLCRAVDGPVVIVIGDDVQPHPQESGPVLAREFLKRFPDTMGVMQPTGDRWGGFAAACISPWIGRKFIETAYGGKGPYCEEYFHFFSDEELQRVAQKLGCFQQIPEIIQYHDHWSRRGDKRPPHLWKANDEWEACRALFLKREAEGFPGHEVAKPEEPAKRKPGRPRKVPVNAGA